ncbi:MAG: ATP-binding protein [Mycoplasmataceae bacterium]|nr:ATP-binding protein [Mycoplasmataceae bacterium]
MNKQLIDSYRNKLLNNDFVVKRDIFDKLKKELVSSNIILIGLRQLGKTILIEQLAKDFLSIEKEIVDSNELSGSTPEKDNFLYLNLKAFSNSTKESIQNEVNGKGYDIVLIDEIQVINDWSNLAQVLVDNNPNTRFIITGSNASALSKETAFRRYKIFNIHPLSFNEYKKIWSNDEFYKYLRFGSYPKANNYSEPSIQYNETIADLIIDKVASEDNEGVKASSLRNFSKSIANYIGNEINQSGLSESAGFMRPTTLNYIRIMKNSMLINTITKFKDKNSKPKEKVYFTDKSMLPYFISEMGNNEMGALIENLVFSSLSQKYDFKYGSDLIQYYRNQNNKEIDFIISEHKLLIEVKFVQDLDADKLSKELNARLMDELSNYKKIVVTKDTKCNINGWEFIPLMEFIGGE